MKKLLEANGIVIHYLANNYILPIHMQSRDDDDELYFYGQAPLTLSEEQPNKEEVRFKIQLKKWSLLAKDYRNIDFYFLFDGETSSYDIMQNLDEHIFDIMKEIMNDDVLFKRLRPFVQSELRDRKLSDILF